MWIKFYEHFFIHTHVLKSQWVVCGKGNRLTPVLTDCLLVQRFKVKKHWGVCDKVFYSSLERSEKTNMNHLWVLLSPRRLTIRLKLVQSAFMILKGLLKLFQVFIRNSLIFWFLIKLLIKGLRGFWTLAP